MQKYTKLHHLLASLLSVFKKPKNIKVDQYLFHFRTLSSKPRDCTFQVEPGKTYVPSYLARYKHGQVYVDKTKKIVVSLKSRSVRILRSV